MHVLACNLNGVHLGYLCAESTRNCQKIIKDKTYAKTYVGEASAVNGAKDYSVACPIEGGVYIAVPKVEKP
jgi:hypothetical protein